MSAVGQCVCVSGSSLLLTTPNACTSDFIVIIIIKLYSEVVFVSHRHRKSAVGVTREGNGRWWASMADDKNVATPPNVGSVALMFLTVRRILSQRNRRSRSCSLRGNVRSSGPIAITRVARSETCSKLSPHIWVQA